MNRLLLVEISTPRHPDTFTLVEESDRELVDGIKWCRDSTGYAVRKVKGKKVLLHRLVTQAKDGEIVDHINRDRLDNRRSNLRIVTWRENCQNITTAENAHEMSEREVILREIATSRVLTATTESSE